MSSHHFVKEGQEPAVFIIDPVPFEVVASLLEWAPLVMVTHTALETVIGWGIKVDIVLAPTEEISSLEKMLVDQHPVDVVHVSSSENFVDAGLNVLADRRATDVNLVVNKWQDIAFDGVNISITIVEPDFRWALISKGIFEKWVAKGTSLWIRSANSSMLTTVGLHNDEDHFTSHEDGVVRIAHQKPFWVGERS